jgi:phosphoenolpyruvate synthase/pyruvate phosphate dikinase
MSRAASSCRSAPTTNTISTPRSRCRTSCAPEPGDTGRAAPAFVERTYKQFFDVMIPAKTSDKELAAWIAPRLEIIRYSIRQAPLLPELKEAIRTGLEADGLMTGPDESVGCFVRSDTNVEDLDNFNGAGLNLTVFNRKSLDDIYNGLREVWASPFEFRSFSWRQTLIDDPLWVLSSVVILEAVPNDKSGVLVTADPNSGEPGRMLVATSEGVGGAVDGTSAETLLWSPQGVELVSLFKSPWRNQLQPGGGSAVVPASGSDTVLAPEEVRQITAAGEKITETFTPVMNAVGKPKPWDIEFGFSKGKLWLFQCRPFLGNDQLKNIPALAPLEGTTSAKGGDTLSLEEKIG